MNKKQTGSDILLLLAFLLSGFAGLGYEFLWTKLLALVLGSETLAVLGVLAGFFGGMVVGAWIFHKRAITSKNPIHYFIVFELIIASFATFSPFLIHWLREVIPPLLGPVAGDNQSLIALTITILISGILLLPATICMGATLPFLVEARKRKYRLDKKGKGLARLYSANTIGATLGVLFSVYIILPTSGLGLGAAILAIGGILSAILAWVWIKDKKNITEKKEETVIRTRLKNRDKWILTIVVFGTGLAGLGLEIGVIHTLTQILENTVYTFANILAVYLLGTAIGAWIYQRKIAVLQKISPWRLVALLLFMLAVSSGLVIAILKGSPQIIEYVISSNASYTHHLLMEFALALVIFIIPTLFMGMLFSHLFGLFESRGIGRIYATNMLGATFAPFVFGLLSVELLGFMWNMRLISLSYLSMFVLIAIYTKLNRKKLLAALIAYAFLMVILPSDLDLLPKRNGWTVKERKESMMGTVVVTEKVVNVGQEPERELLVNRRFRMGGGMSFGEKRMGHIPLILAKGAKKALFIGLGTGATLGTARDYPLSEIDAVEIVPGILEVMPMFSRINNDIMLDEKVHFHAADARRFISATNKTYDVIVADLFHPGRDGAGNLYSVEHFSTLKKHLTEGGIMVQWIPLHEFDEQNLKILIHTFLHVFPETFSMLGLYNTQVPLLALVGKQNDQPHDIQLFHLDQRLKSGFPALEVIQDVNDFLASYFAGKDALKEYSEGALLNTDLRPHIMFKAPRNAYVVDRQSGHNSFLSILPYRELYPKEFLVFPNATVLTELRSKVKKTWTAVQYYLEADLQFYKDGRKMISAKTLQKYIQAYKEDPQFAPARGILFEIARHDPNRRKLILDELIESDKAKLK